VLRLLQVHMPVVDVVLEHLQAAQAAGRGDDDWSALAAAVRQRSGRADTAAPEVT
jgi:3-hydroxyisobutyrate dehydrogenase-like beta-hydroxyacid dehydrogenase